jgi:phosphohistidine swiveling domain-containing protein
MNAGARSGFPSPFEVQIPAGCEGWEEMYPYHALFSEDRRAFDESRFWFQDSLHWPEPFCPFDALQIDFALAAYGQASARLLVVPPSLGVEARVLNGYVYLSDNSVTDEAKLARREELFARRGGHYFEHWNELYDNWRRKVERTIRELESLEVPVLPEFEDETVVTEGRGWGSSHALLVAYERLLESFDLIWQYHFELLNLGYGAYFSLYEVCREAFPGIDDQTIARMVSGIDVALYQPDEELKRLAGLALELRVDDVVRGAQHEEELRVALTPSRPGARWLADFDATKTPWFHYSYGTGLYHHHRSWIDDTTLPIGVIGSYIERLQAGEDIARPRDAVLADRDRITAEHRSLLSEESRRAFDKSLDLARTVFPYVENHNFFIEHWYFTVFWNKVREFGGLLARGEFLQEAADVFYLRHDEVRAALEELRLLWSTGGAGLARGPGYWPPIVSRRKSIHEAMREWVPPEVLGEVPQAITDPVTIMLWGLTTERIEEWRAQSEDRSGVLAGLAASPGVVEGPARVIFRADQLDELKQGEILVAPSTSPSWTPVFARIVAAVSDIGGVMSHAAIVAREYGLPAVVGAAGATKRIRTGDRLRVDGTAGTVTVLD